MKNWQFWAINASIWGASNRADAGVPALAFLAITLIFMVFQISLKDEK